ncbi:MAG: Imm26 family immunity protein [Flavobacteriales bacterium]
MKLKTGDCFTIPITENEIGIGQIIETKEHSFYVAIFEKKIHVDELSKSTLEGFLNSKVLFFGETTDARLYHKIWKILENKPAVIKNSEIPFFKVKTLLGMILVDYKGNKIRKINSKESETYNYETSYSPIRFENALKAYHKILPWDESFLELYYKKR